MSYFLHLRHRPNHPNEFILPPPPQNAVVEVEQKKEEVTKSKEQLEAEKRSIIEQRVPPLNIASLNMEQLKARAKELHDLLFRIEGECYDLGQRFKRQSYDVSLSCVPIKVREFAISFKKCI